jgi:hypothetical protein
VLNKKANRSGKYQSFYAELPYSNDMMCEFPDQSPLLDDIEDDQQKERYTELKSKLAEAFWRVVEGRLTERQGQVLHLVASGYTQIEIAKILKVNQSSVAKSVHGNCDYKKGKKSYGGSEKKLRKLCQQDPEIAKILKQISELEDFSDSFKKDIED